MKINKKNILIAMIIILIILVSLILLLKKEDEESGYKYTADMNENVENIEESLYFRDYITIKNCLISYFDGINIENSAYYGRDENNNFTKIVEEKEIKQKIYNMLSQNYIQKNKINVEDVYKYIETSKEKKIVIPITIDNKTFNNNTTNVKVYTVSVIEMIPSNRQNYDYKYLIINIDSKNKTFSIEPLKDKKELENFNVNYKIDSIEKNSNNSYKEPKTTTEDIALDYFSNYKDIILSDSKLAYNYLDKEYAEKRFNNLDGFNKFIEEKRNILEKIRVEKYSVNYYNEYTEYTCMDQFGNYYIFNERKVMDYSVMLDNYTTPTKEFIEKYDSVNEQKKVILNIQKFIYALNDKSFYYAYNCLSEGFKNNYFKTQEDFEKYVNKYLFKGDIEVKYADFEVENGLYKYTITIMNKENTQEKIDKTIIMKLNDGTNFELSFNV